MRDLFKYSRNYHNLPYEKYMVKYRRDHVINLFAKLNKPSILDVGCGTDPMFSHFDNYKKYTIVEPTKKFYKKALRIKKNNVDIYNLTFEKFVDKYENNFDLIIVGGLLHELEKPRIFIKKLYKFSTKKNIIHINVPNAHSFHRLLAYEMGLIKSVYELSNTQKKMQQHSVYSIDSLKKIFLEEGFRVLKSGTFIFKPYTHNQMAKIYKFKIQNLKNLEKSNSMIKYLPMNGAEIFLNLQINV
jgi:SAM-dependent methyltransferase